MSSWTPPSDLSAVLGQLHAVLTAYFIHGDLSREGELLSFRDSASSLPYAAGQLLQPPQLENPAPRATADFFACVALAHAVETARLGPADVLTVREAALAALQGPPLASRRAAALLAALAGKQWNEQHDGNVVWSSYPEDMLALLDAAPRAALAAIGAASDDCITTPVPLPAYRRQLLHAGLTEAFPRLAEPLVSMLHASLPATTGAGIMRSELVDEHGEREVIVRTAIETLGKYLSWLPVETVAKVPQLMEVLASWACVPDDCGEAAIDAILELLVQTRFPPAVVPFVASIHVHTSQLLESVAIDGVVDGLPADYLTKVTRLAATMIERHFARLEGQQQFDAASFLELYFRFTFAQEDSDVFVQCLSAWEHFLAFVQSRRDAGGQASMLSKITMKKYQNGLTLLFSTLLDQVQFRGKANFLADLDDSVAIDEDGQTARAVFVNGCCTVMAQVADLYFAQCLNLIVDTIRSATNDFQTIHERIGIQDQSSIVKGQLHNVGTCLRLLSRVAPIFSSSFGEYFSLAADVLQAVLAIGNVGSKHLTALLAGGSAVAQWVPDFASVQELALTTLIMFVEWLAQFSNARTAQMSHAQSPGGISPKSSVASVDVSSRDFVEIVNQVLSVALNSLKPSFPAEHAARLFRSVIVTVRPVGLVSFPAIADTVNRASELCCDLSLETQGAFLGAATNAILQSIAEAGADERPALVAELVRYVHVQVGELKQDVAVLRRVFYVLSGICESVRGERQEMKVWLYEAVDPFLEKADGVFSMHMNSANGGAVLEAVLHFYVHLFAVLTGVNAGAEKFSGTINSMLMMLLGPDLSGHIARFPQVFVRLLELVKVVIGDMRMARDSERMVKIVVSCVEVLLPFLRAAPPESQVVADLEPVLVDLVHESLLAQWRTYVPRSVNATLGQAASPSAEAARADVKVDEARVMLETICFPLTRESSTPEQLSSSLGCLLSLNKAHRLFESVLFSPELGIRHHVLSVLLSMLMNSVFQAHRDETVQVMFDIASVDWERFYSGFLQTFLVEIGGLSDSQKGIIATNVSTATDFPTFSKEIIGFAEDIARFVRDNKAGLT